MFERRPLFDSFLATFFCFSLLIQPAQSWAENEGKPSPASALSKPASESLPETDCEPHFKKLRFGVKAALTGMTIVALLANTYRLSQQNSTLTRQLNEAKQVLQNQETGIGSAPSAQMKAWNAEINALPPGQRGDALDSIYSIARLAPAGGQKTMARLLAGLESDEQVAGYLRWWASETDPVKRKALLDSMHDQLRLIRDRKREGDNKIIADIHSAVLQHIKQSSGPDRSNRLHEFSETLEGYQAVKLSAKNAQSWMEFSEDIMADQSPRSLWLKTAYLNSLASQAHIPSVELAAVLARELEDSQPHKENKNVVHSPRYVADVAHRISNNPASPSSGITLEFMVNALAGASSASARDYFKRDEIPSSAISPFIKPENAAKTLESATRDGLVHGLAKASLNAMTDTSNVGDSLDSLIRLMESASQSDHENAEIYRTFLARSLTQYMTKKRELGSNTQERNYHQVLKPEWEVSLTEAQWDTIAAHLRLNPENADNLFSGASRHEDYRAPAERSRPLATRLAKLLEEDFKNHPDPQTYSAIQTDRLVALASIARFDPQSFSKEKVMEMAKNIAKKRDFSYRVEQILQGSFFGDGAR